MTIHTVSLFGGKLDGTSTGTPDLSFLPKSVSRAGLNYMLTNWNDSVGRPVYMLEDLLCERGDKLVPPALWTQRKDGDDE